MTSYTEHRSTARVLDALSLVAQCGKAGYTLTEICQQLDAPKSSMLPILRTLVQRHFLAFDSESSRYSISYAAFQTGNAYLEKLDALSEINTQLQHITDTCAETSYFATLKDGCSFYIAKHDSPETIRMAATVGYSLPAYSTGIGKALLADYTLADLQKLYPEGLQPLTPHTITDIHRLAAQLEAFRATGYFYEEGESTPHVRCVAVPLRKDRVVVSAISVAVPAFRYTKEKEQMILHLLDRAKQHLEHIFQYADINLSSIP